jgi:hypothetical protein
VHILQAILAYHCFNDPFLLISRHESIKAGRYVLVKALLDLKIAYLAKVNLSTSCAGSYPRFSYHMIKVPDLLPSHPMMYPLYCLNSPGSHRQRRRVSGSSMDVLGLASRYCCLH